MKHCPQCRQTYSDTQRFCLNDGELLSLRDPYHLIGRTLDEKYRLDALIGIGGMGAVYSAHHLGIDRHVAIKVLLPNIAFGNPQIISLFEREAKIAGRLSHDNIVNIFDAGRTDDDIAYMVMEWLDGRTLEEEITAQKVLSFERTAETLRQIAAALEEAHGRHIIHRDLKPSNVMLIKRRGGGERIKVLDFGISKVLSATAGSPVSSVMGTPLYASPEQFQVGGNIDGRSDIYSLGVMIFEMLTGAVPFQPTSMPELILLQMNTPPPPLREGRPDAPAALEQLVNRLLAKDPDARPQSVSEIPALFDQALSAVEPPPAAVVKDEAAPIGRKTPELAVEPTPPTKPKDKAPPPKPEPPLAEKSGPQPASAREEKSEPSVSPAWPTPLHEAKAEVAAEPLAVLFHPASPSPVPNAEPEFIAVLPAAPTTTPITPLPTTTLAELEPTLPLSAEEADLTVPLAEKTPLPSVPASKLTMDDVREALRRGLFALKRLAPSGLRRLWLPLSLVLAAGLVIFLVAQFWGTARVEALRYYLELERLDASSSGLFRITGLDPLSADQRFKFHFSPRTNGYIYIISERADKVIKTLLTAHLQDAGGQSNRVLADSDFQFPSGDNWIKLPSGNTTRFTVILSPVGLDKPVFLAAPALRELTAAEQQEFKTFREQFKTSTEVKSTLEGGQPTLSVNAPAGRSETAPLIFDISIKQQ